MRKPKSQKTHDVPEVSAITEASFSDADELTKLARAFSLASAGGLQPVLDLLQFVEDLQAGKATLFSEKEYRATLEISIKLMTHYLLPQRIQDPESVSEEDLARMAEEFQKTRGTFLDFLRSGCQSMISFRSRNAEELKSAENQPETVQAIAPFILLEALADGIGEKFSDVIASIRTAKDSVIVCDDYPDLFGRAISHYLQFDRINTAVKAEEALFPIEGPGKPDATEVISRRPSKMHLPVDVINSNLWPARQYLDGQISMDLTSAPGHQVQFGLSMDLEELQKEGVKLSQTLTLFDKRVYTAANAEYKHGNDVFSLTALYKTMGNSGRPKSETLTKISASLSKMGSIHLWYNNKGETGTNYEQLEYDGKLLPFERVSKRINGKLTDAAIHLFRQPPLMDFAEARKQLFSVPIEVLQSPVNKTEQNLGIDDYLLTRIAHMKSKTNALRGNRKILFVTLFEKCNIKSPSQRSKSKETIRKYLTHYQSCCFIAGFTEEKDGIKILL